MSEVKTFWNNEKELALIDKNKNEKIKVIYGERQEKSFIDIRVYKVVDDKLKATTKGVAIPLEGALEISKIILNECDNK